jgi:hypothetical protein
VADNVADQGGYLPVAATADGLVVRAPFVGASWHDRGSVYRRRRALATVAIAALTLLAVALTVLFVAALARSDSWAARLAAVMYALMSIPGAVLGRRWLNRTPVRAQRASDRFVSPLGLLLFVFLPVLAGAGLAILPALVGKDFPGERLARELTAAIAEGQSGSHQKRLG